VDGITKAGFVEGRDYTLRVLNAQGDMSTLSTIMASVKADHQPPTRPKVPSEDQ